MNGGGLVPALIGFQLIAQPLIGAERTQSGTFNGADVNEAVLAALVGDDKPVSLVASKNLTVPIGIDHPFGKTVPTGDYVGGARKLEWEK